MEELVKETQKAKSEITQYVCFKLAKEEYAINIHKVYEVTRVPRITPLPQVPPFVLGVVNIRGKVAAVFDLRKKFSLPETAINKLTTLIVIVLRGQHFGLIVDEIIDNINLSADNIDPAPSVKLQIDKAVIKGIAVLDKRIIAILELEKLIEDINKTIKE